MSKFAWVARRPCGKVSAAAWEDGWDEESKSQRLSEWVSRGDTVEREDWSTLEEPEWICYPGCDCSQTER
jgi:hypothetical protein